MSKNFCWHLLSSSCSHRTYRDISKPFSAKKHTVLAMKLRWTWSKIGAVLIPGAQLVDDSRAVVVHPFNNPFLIAGQETAMIEFVDQADDLDIVLGLIGDGSLLFSLCLSAQVLQPSIAI